jgi:hypothetical protein
MPERRRGGRRRVVGGPLARPRPPHAPRPARPGARPHWRARHAERRGSGGGYGQAAQQRRRPPGPPPRRLGDARPGLGLRPLALGSLAVHDQALRVDRGRPAGQKREHVPPRLYRQRPQVVGVYDALRRDPVGERAGDAGEPHLVALLELRDAAEQRLVAVVGVADDDAAGRPPAHREARSRHVAGASRQVRVGGALPHRHAHAGVGSLDGRDPAARVGPGPGPVAVRRPVVQRVRVLPRGKLRVHRPRLSQRLLRVGVGLRLVDEADRARPELVGRQGLDDEGAGDQRRPRHHREGEQGRDRGRGPAAEPTPASGHRLPARPPGGASRRPRPPRRPRRPPRPPRSRRRT